MKFSFIPRLDIRAVTLAALLVFGGAFGMLAHPAAAQQGFFSAAEIANAPSCGSFPAGQNLYLCSCGSGFQKGSVWGSGPYTGDSNVCTAALHAGVISSKGGTVLALGAPGQASYAGSSKNGVSTGSWGKYDNSFFVRAVQKVAANQPLACGKFPDGSDSYSCSCSASATTQGSVWGSGPYTADSSLCAAARHAGAIGPKGGAINVLRFKGLAKYIGSASNGVNTSDWGAYDTSVIINRN